MKVFKYNFGKHHKGLYCDFDGIPQYYNVLLFLKAVSGRSKTGQIKISLKRKTGWFRLVRSSSDGFSSHYYFDKPPKKGSVHFSLDPQITRAKVIWIKVSPNKSL